jgi:hypothetical protein
MNFQEFWHKYNQTITSVSIIIFLVFAVTMIIKDHNLKLEINDNCGWGEEDYECYCKKDTVNAIKYDMGEIDLNLDIEDVDS